MSDEKRYWLGWGDRRWGPYLSKEIALEVKREMEAKGGGPFTLVPEDEVKNEVKSSH